jgi:predicted RNA-binding protein YlqC (UPF0109 family)
MGLITEDEQSTVSMLRNLLLVMARSLVHNPDEIVVTDEATYARYVSFTVWCEEEDAGALIGKHGRTAGNMRFIVMSAASARGFRVGVQFLSRDQHELPAR